MPLGAFNGTSYGFKHIVERATIQHLYCCNGTFIVYLVSEGFQIIKKSKKQRNIQFKLEILPQFDGDVEEKFKF